jgi:hypothetical protein
MESMSIYIDKKFVNFVGASLEKFAWKKDTLASCRCPICGDSSKNKNKTRGFFFVNKNKYFYKCHNCGVSCNLYGFLEKVSPSLCKEYSLEVWKDGDGMKTKKKIEPAVTVKKVKKKYTIELPSVSELPPNHPCRTFVERRKIPRSAWKYLYYAEDFVMWVGTINPKAGEALDKCTQQFNIPLGSRLVIPTVNENGELIGAQGRIITIPRDPKLVNLQRYITVKAEGHDQDHKGWFGLDRVDTGTVYVTEGPLDSLFVPNCVAMLGLSDALNIPNHLKSRSLVYLIDNEPRNEAVVSTIAKLLEQDKKVCIWPDHIKQKDLNDMIMAGMSEKELLQTIKENTVSGLSGKIKFNNWKKI